MNSPSERSGAGIGDPAVRTVVVEELTTDAFDRFGTVIPPLDDGVPFGPQDAVLDLGRGTPRFYTMRLPARPPESTTGTEFSVTHITHHRRVTQTLASAGGQDWFLAVAPPVEATDPADRPELEEIRAFQIPGDTAVMLYAGTWHAGPLFAGAARSFFNLELSDTNIVDHHTCDLVAVYGTRLQVTGSSE